MNNENLVSLATRTTEEKREIGKKGGVASGKARREKRTMAEALRFYLETGDIQDQIALAVIDECINGKNHTQNLKILTEVLGEFSVNNKIEVTGVNPDIAKKIEDALK